MFLDIEMLKMTNFAFGLHSFSNPLVQIEIIEIGVTSQNDLNRSSYILNAPHPRHVLRRFPTFRVVDAVRIRVETFLIAELEDNEYVQIVFCPYHGFIYLISQQY